MHCQSEKAGRTQRKPRALAVRLVADGATQEVRVFGPDGTYRMAFGGTGAGPGEYRNITGLQFDGRGRLWVADLGNGRYDLLDASYERIGEAPMRLPPFMLPWAGGFDSEGRVYDAMTSMDPDDRISFTFIRTSIDSPAWTDTLPATS
jgi:6-bladed beta-propeller